jgi:hypothetical protein
MGQHSIPPWMIPTKRPEQPAQIPLPAPEPQSIYDRRRPEESDRERDPFSIDIGGDNGDEPDRSRTYRF